MNGFMNLFNDITLLLLVINCEEKINARDH